MEVLDHQKLNEGLLSHRKAIEGEAGFNRLDMRTFFEKELTNFYIKNVEDLSSYPIHNSSFKNCIFNKVDFGRAEFFQTTFINCVFENCSFIKSDIQEIMFVNCIFQDVNFFGCSLDGSIKNCLMENCRLDMMHLSESQIVNTIFTGATKPPNLRDNEEHNVIWDISSPVSE